MLGSKSSALYLVDDADSDGCENALHLYSIEYDGYMYDGKGSETSDDAQEAGDASVAHGVFVIGV